MVNSDSQLLGGRKSVSFGTIPKSRDESGEFNYMLTVTLLVDSLHNLRQGVTHARMYGV